MSKKIVDALFQTQALRVSPADQPFWYTSGLFGPYYINTHFLYGSETDAKNLLNEIEFRASDFQRHEFTKKIAVLSKKQYDSNAIYRSIIDALVEAATHIECDFVSGGERRDFFFSLEVARRLGKAHLSIFKDLTAYYSEDLYSEGHLLEKNALFGKKALHIADLITEASSYFRAWIPAIKACGAEMSATIAVVDRCQGGLALLEHEEIDARCLVRISDALFAEAKNKNLINKEQELSLKAYARDPYAFMHGFLSEHPHFLEEESKKDKKTAERVERLKKILKNENGLE